MIFVLTDTKVQIFFTFLGDEAAEQQKDSPPAEESSAPHSPLQEEDRTEVRMLRMDMLLVNVQPENFRATVEEGIDKDFYVL